MFSYKAKSISTILPRKVVEDYPKFTDFLEAYYEWKLKTTFELRSVQGSFDMATHVVSKTTELTQEIEVVVNTEESFITMFEGRDTFIRDEGIYSYRASGDPLPYTVSNKFENVFDEKITDTLTFFRGHTYTIANNSGDTLTINRVRTTSSDFEYGSVVNNGASSGNLIFNVGDDWPDFLFFVSGLHETIGTIRIKDVPDEFTGITANLSDAIIPYGFAQVDRVLFHPEFLYENFDQLHTTDAPNALFDRFLQDRGLNSFFKNNLINRAFFENFTEFYRKRGTEEGIKFFFQNFFGSNVSFDYPGERMLIPSESTYFLYDAIYVRADFGDEFFRSTVVRGLDSGAIGYIEGIKYSELGDYFKLFFNRHKTSGVFRVNESIRVEDIDDPTILHDVGGKVLGTVVNYRVVQPGNLYTLNQEIAQTFSWGGVSEFLKFTVTDISSTPIRTLSIVAPGSGYAVGDVLYFPTPEPKTEFHGVFTCDTSGNKRYTNATVRVNMEDTSLYEPIVWSGNTFTYHNTTYNIVSFTSGTPTEILVSPTPTVTSGDPIKFTIDSDDVTDNFYDSAGIYFHPQSRVLKRGARAVVTATGVSGTISGVSITNPGAGYILRPTTASGISIVTTSGAGANIHTTGQGFGGIVKLEQARDIVDVRFDDSIIFPSNGGSDDGAFIQLEQGSTVDYGKFFKSNLGFLSDKIYLQDSYFYQAYSYVIETDLSLSDYSELFKKLQHVAGEQFFNKLVIIRYFDQRLNAGARTATVKLDYAISKLFTDVFSFTTTTQTGTLDVTVIVREAEGTIFWDRWYRDFHWASSTIEDLESVELIDYEKSYVYTGSGIVAAGAGGLITNGLTAFSTRDDAPWRFSLLYEDAPNDWYVAQVIFNGGTSIDISNVYPIDPAGAVTISGYALSRLEENSIISVNSTDNKARVITVSGITAATTSFDIPISGGANVALSGKGIGDASVVALTSNTIVIADSWTEPGIVGNIQAWSYDGATTFTESGAPLTISGITSGSSSQRMCRLSNSHFVYWDDINQELRAYEFTGSGFSQIGNSYSLPKSTTISQYLIERNSTNFVYAYRDTAGGGAPVSGYPMYAQRYQFDGTDFTQNGERFDVAPGIRVIGEAYQAGVSENVAAFVDSNFAGTVIWNLGSADPELTLSGFDEVYSRSTDKIYRDTDEPPFVGDAFGYIEDTISGIGFLTYSGIIIASGTSIGPELTMTGSGTLFTSIPSGIAYDDVIHASGYDFLVKEVVSDTEAVVQRLNTTGSTPITLAGVPFTFTRKRRTDLYNARLLDILYFGDLLTASGYINDTIEDWTKTLQVN